MSDRPSFQFYPGYWRRNANLSRCSHAMKGIWIDIMCLLHDSNEYGVLRWPFAEVAKVVGCRTRLIHDLAQKRVLKGADSDTRFDGLIYVPTHARMKGDPVVLLEPQDGPIILSSRMVIDEYNRLNRGKNTRFTPSPGQSPDESPSPRHGERQGDGSSSASSSSSSEELREPTYRAPPGVVPPRPSFVCPDDFVPHPTIQDRLRIAGAGPYTQLDVEAFISYYRANSPPPGFTGNWHEQFKVWMIRKKNHATEQRPPSGAGQSRKSSAAVLSDNADPESFKPMPGVG